MALATDSGGVVINADSAQLYRDLPVLSAAPSPDDHRRADHRLYGVIDAAQSCSAADWARRAREEIARVHGEGRLPILVGGTGLYIRSLLDGIAPVPPIEQAVRERVRARPVDANHAELERIDPVAAARFNPGDTTRIARALEVMLSTGRPIHEWQLARSGGIAGDVALRPLILLPSRDWLYARCEARFAAMLDQGAIAETQALIARNLDPALPAMRAIGVREIMAMLTGELTRAQALAAGAQATRNYAKRQYTWFANQPPQDWPRFREALEPETLASALSHLR